MTTDTQFDAILLLKCGKCQATECRNVNSPEESRALPAELGWQIQDNQVTCPSCSNVPW